MGQDRIVLGHSSKDWAVFDLGNLEPVQGVDREPGKVCDPGCVQCWLLQLSPASWPPVHQHRGALATCYLEPTFAPPPTSPLKERVNNFMLNLR